jgi:hypothetical protein
MENWKAVVGYEGLYEVSDLGRVRSLPRPTGHRGRILKPNIQPRHYPCVAFSRKCKLKTFAVHRLVLEAFVGPCPEGKEACHNNGVWDDCRLVNLRWDTRKANHFDKRAHGTHNGGARHYKAKFTPEQVREIRAAQESCAALGRKHGVSTSCIAYMKRRETYAEVT